MPGGGLFLHEHVFFSDTFRAADFFLGPKGGQIFFWDPRGGRSFFAHSAQFLCEACGLILEAASFFSSTGKRGGSGLFGECKEEGPKKLGYRPSQIGPPPCQNGNSLMNDWTVFP